MTIGSWQSMSFGLIVGMPRGLEVNGLAAADESKREERRRLRATIIRVTIGSEETDRAPERRLQLVEKS